MKFVEPEFSAFLVFEFFKNCKKFSADNYFNIIQLIVFFFSYEPDYLLNFGM